MFFCVARGATLVATHCSGGPDFTKECKKLLQTPIDSKEQRIIGKNLFTIVKSGELVFFYVSEDTSDRKSAFSVLDGVVRRWNSRFLQESLSCGEGELTTRASGVFKVNTIQSELDETQEVLRDTIGKAMARGGELESLNSKSEELLGSSNEFKSQATNLKNAMRWQCIKHWAFIFLVIAIIVYVILVVICGGWRLKPRCL